MKKMLSMFIAAVFIFSLVSCDGMLPGVGNESGERTDPPADTSEEMDICVDDSTEIVEVLVDWGDFVRTHGVTYRRDIDSEKTVDASEVGDLIGKVTRHVTSSYASIEECNADAKIEGTASFAPIGTEIYAVKGTNYSAAVFIDGVYYRYEADGDKFSMFYDVWGYSDFGCMTDNGGVIVNSREELKESLYNADMIDSAELQKFDDEFFSDHTLAILQFTANHGGVEYGVEYVSKNGKDLKIGMVMLESAGGGDEALHTWTFFVSIFNTEDKNMVIEMTAADPSESNEIMPYGDMSEYLNNIDFSTLKVYEGKALWNKSAVEEMITSKYGKLAQVYDLAIKYEPIRQYWYAEFMTISGCLGMGYKLIIRAADGKIIAGDR